MRKQFGRVVSRQVRSGDGTVSIDKIRFEVPERYRHQKNVRLAYAAWNLSRAYLIDNEDSQTLCQLMPLDNQANASSQRRTVASTAPVTALPSTEPPVAAPSLAPSRIRDETQPQVA